MENQKHFQNEEAQKVLKEVEKTQKTVGADDIDVEVKEIIANETQEEPIFNYEVNSEKTTGIEEKALEQTKRNIEEAKQKISDSLVESDPIYAQRAEKFIKLLKKMQELETEIEGLKNVGATEKKLREKRDLYKTVVGQASELGRLFSAQVGKEMEKNKLYSHLPNNEKIDPNLN